MSVTFGAATLSLPNHPSLNLSSLRVFLNPSSLKTHLPVPSPLHLFNRSTKSDLWEIRMGGGPRTFPGGVSKWQWKRMQAKKAKQLLKARLCRERQIYEMRKRAELQAAVSDLERPWEAVARAPKLFSVNADEQVKSLADRFQRPGGYDLWSDSDGPQLFRSPVDGLPTARFFPKGVVHSIRPYRGRRIAGNTNEDLDELGHSQSNSVAEDGNEGLVVSERKGEMRSRRSWRHRGGGRLKGGVGDPVMPSHPNSMGDFGQVHTLGNFDSKSIEDNRMKGRRSIAVYDDRNRRAVAGRNHERESGLEAGVGLGGNYIRRGSSGSRGGSSGKNVNQRRHVSQNSPHRLDSDADAGYREENRRSPAVGRGRYNGSNRRFGAKKLGNSSQSDVSGRAPFADYPSFE